MRHVHAGTGPGLVVLHGFGTRPDDLTGVVDVLARRWEVLVPDWADVGPLWSRRRAVAAVVGLVDRYGLDAPWVVGHSWGGALAVELAARHPDRVAGLVLVDSLAQAERWTYLRDVFGDRGSGGGDGDGGGAERRGGGDDDRSTAGSFLRTWGRAPLALTSAALWGYVSDRAPALAAVRRHQLPAAVLWGRDDGLLAAEDGRRLAGRIGASFAVVGRPGAVFRHQWIVTHPDVLAEELARIAADGT